MLLITHPNGAKSFDCEDRWDGDTLIYTGRGKTGVLVRAFQLLIATLRP
jgi:hypothetical protein